MLSYSIITTAEEYRKAAKLFREYAAWLGIDLCFQHFEEELAALGKMYSAPTGGIILCRQGDCFVGCVGVRRIDDRTAELKRMYVQPAHQHKGIGKALLEKSLALAKDLKYELIRLDTLNSMKPAIHLYTQYGFYEIPAYYHNPESTAIYMEKKL